MTDKEKIHQLLYKFVSGGLIEKDIKKLVGCFSDQLLGIGIGEQGFVKSLEDVRNVIKAGIKEDDNCIYRLDFGKEEILILEDRFGVVCVDIIVVSEDPALGGKTYKSHLQQSLSVIKKQDEWLICGLHASTPIVTEESIAAYPLKFAEKTLRSLKEKIGEEAYRAEEQYRRAVLSDAIAFYIINFTKDCFEKCQLQNDICIYADPNTAYESFIQDKAPEYVLESDRAIFLESISLKNIESAFTNNSNEVACEYRMKCPDGTYIWTKTIIRLITDVKTGDKKGIMYVKNIDKEKREALEIQEKANLDGMTRLLNKEAMISETNSLLNQQHQTPGGVFLMVDIDDFKNINDNFGHPVGDWVLIALAKALVDIFGPEARVGRLGGDEFAVFLANRQIDKQVKEEIEMLLTGVRNFKNLENPGLKISVSVGGVYLSEGNFANFYQVADRALYNAKGSGKDKAYWI